MYFIALYIRIILIIYGSTFNSLKINKNKNNILKWSGFYDVKKSLWHISDVFLSCFYVCFFFFIFAKFTLTQVAFK